MKATTLQAVRHSMRASSCKVWLANWQTFPPRKMAYKGMEGQRGNP